MTAIVCQAEVRLHLNDFPRAIAAARRPQNADQSQHVLRNSAHVAVPCKVSGTAA